MPASSPPAPPWISTITSLSSLGSRSTIARRISSSSRSRSGPAAAPSSRPAALGPRRVDVLAHVLALVEQLLEAVLVGPRAPPLGGELGGPLHLAVLATDLRGTAAVTEYLGVAHQALQLGVALLDLLDESFDHGLLSLFGQWTTVPTMVARGVATLLVAGMLGLPSAQAATTPLPLRTVSVDGDRYADVVLGEYERSRVLVFRGGPTGLRPEIVTPGRRRADLGDSAGMLGDFDGDGLADLYATAPGIHGKHTTTVYVVRGARPFSHVNLAHPGRRVIRIRNVPRSIADGTV